jgi:hypothetical protein
MHVSKDGKSVLLIPDLTYSKVPFIYRKEGLKWKAYSLDIDIKGKDLFHMYGTISATGAKVSITISFGIPKNDSYIQKSEIFIYQKYANYEQVDYHSFPHTNYMDEVGTNALGDLLVMGGSDSVRVLTSSC